MRGLRHVCWPGRDVIAMLPENLLHTILQLQLLFFQGDFFELFGFAQVGLAVQSMQALIEFVMLHDEGAELLVDLQQMSPQL
jgi:hypothetical protein